MEVVVTALDRERKDKAARRKMRYRRLRDSSGHVVNCYVVDFAGANTASEFAKAFQSSVTKARRLNVQIFGSPDVEPERG